MKCKVISLVALIAVGYSGMVVGQEIANNGIGGMIKSHTDVVLAATTSGNVISLNKRIGDQVKEGDIVAKLNCDVQNASYARSKAELSKAQISVKNKREQFEQSILSAIELEAAEADLVIAKAGARQQVAQISQCTIKASSAGTIVIIPVSVGQWVQQGEPVVQIVDTSALYVALNAPESAWQAMKPGKKINAMVETTGATVEAIISTRSNYINEHGAFLVQAEIQNTKEAIPGMRVIVQTR